MAAIILGNPTDIQTGSVVPVQVPAYTAEEAVIVLSDGYNPYIIEGGGGGSSDSYWFRYTSGLLRPITITDKIVIGGTSLLNTESLRVVGKINSTSIQLGSSVTISSILDEDDMVSNSNTAVPTQQSVKAYVDNQVGGFLQSGDNISELVNDVPYLTTEVEPLFTASVAYGITSTNTSNWNTAYGWGNHASAGYLTTETDPVFVASDAYGIDNIDITNWNTSYTNTHTHTNKALLDSLLSSGSGLNFLSDDGTYKLFSITVAGSDTQLQFNNGGSSFGASADFTVNTTSGTLNTTNLSVANTIYIGGLTTYIDDVAGDLTFTDANAGSVTLTTLVAGATNFWTGITGGIYYGTGSDKVGINTNLPNESLTVIGNIEATQFNSKYYRYNGNWLVGTNVGGPSLLRTNVIAFDNTDTATPLALMDLTTRQLEFDGDVILSSTKSLTVGSTTNTQYLQFNTSPVTPSHSEGLVYWNDEKHTLNLMPDINGSILQVGQEMWVRVHNNTGSTISDGTPVYVVSAAGDLVYIAPARANSEATSLTTFGLTNSEILNGQEGYVTILGGVHNLNTSSLTEGGIVYVSTSVAGGLTSTRPTAPNSIVAVGICTVRDVSVGVIQVRITVQPTVERLSNVYISGISDQEVLSWDATNNRWKNRPVTATPPSDGIFDWDVANNRYQPYSTQQASLSFDSSSTFPVLNTRLNLNGDLYATRIHSKDVRLEGIAGVSVLTLGNVSGINTLTLPTTTGTLALTSDIITPTDDILDWSTNKYTPFTSKQSGINLYTGTTDPDGTTRLNLNADLHVSTLRVVDKLDVGGLIDPTGLQLDPVAANPGTSTTIWSNSGDSNKLYYNTNALGLGQSTGLTYNPANPFLFDKDYQYNNYTLTANITPTYSLTGAVALNGVAIVFVGDGIHTVDFSNFTESATSGSFDITDGAENSVIFYYNGNVVYYTIVSSILASSITFTPYGSITSTNVQSAIQELDNEKQTIINNSFPYVQSANYYVATTGSDSNPGTYALPFATLRKALSVVTSGQKILIRGGVYDMNVNRFSANIGIGIWNMLPASTIYIEGYQGERPIFDFTNLVGDGTSFKTGISFADSSNLYFKNFEIRNLSQHPSATASRVFNIEGCTNVTVENVYVHRCGGVGFRTANSMSNILFLNCDSSDNYDLYTTPAGADADGFETGNSNTAGAVTFKNCRSWNNSDDGYDCWYNNGYVIFDNCIAAHNGYIPGTETSAGDGNGFKLGQTTVSRSTVILRTLKNCISFDNRQYGFNQNNCDGIIQLYNVTSYNNKVRGFWFFTYNNAHVIRNSISYKNTTDTFLSNTIHDHNSWDIPLTITDIDFASVSPEGVISSRTLDGSYPINGFLKLREGSQLINAGVDVGIPYYGASPDLGAYEYYQIPASSITLVDDVLNFSTDKYTPYTSKTTGLGFYTGTTNPDGTTRLNLNGNLHASNFTGYTTSGQALYGQATTGYGVFGIASSSGIGVVGSSITGSGISGLSESGHLANFTHTVNVARSNPYIYINKGTTGTVNDTSDVIYILDNAPTSGTISGKVLSATIDSTERISLNPRVAPGSGGTAYLFDTHSSITATGDRIFDFKSNGTSKLAFTGDNWLKISDQNFIRLVTSGTSAGASTWNIPGQLYINSNHATEYTTTISSGLSTALSINHRSIGGNNSGNSIYINRSSQSTYNMSGDILSISDGGSVSTSGTISGKILTVSLGSPGSDSRPERIFFDPRVIDSSSASAYLFDTHNNLTTTGAKLVSFKNQGVEKVYFSNQGNIARTAGTSSTFAIVGGVLKDFYTDVSTSGTSETDLYSYTIPANVLVNNGDKLIFHFVIYLGSSTAQNASVYFGNKFISVMGTDVNNTGDLITDVIITKTSLSTAYAEVINRVYASGSAYILALTGLDFTTSNILKNTAKCGTNTMTAKVGYIEYKPAAIN